jgi:hypothetical protein
VGGRPPSYSFGHPGASWSATTNLLGLLQIKQIIGEVQPSYSFETQTDRASGLRHKRVEYSVHLTGIQRGCEQKLYDSHVGYSKNYFSRGLFNAVGSTAEDVYNMASSELGRLPVVSQ